MIGTFWVIRVYIFILYSCCCTVLFPHWHACSVVFTTFYGGILKRLFHCGLFGCLTQETRKPGRDQSSSTRQKSGSTLCEPRQPTLWQALKRLCSLETFLAASNSCSIYFNVQKWSRVLREIFDDKRFLEKIMRSITGKQCVQSPYSIRIRNGDWSNSTDIKAFVQYKAGPHFIISTGYGTINLGLRNPSVWNLE